MRVVSTRLLLQQPIVNRSYPAQGQGTNTSRLPTSVCDLGSYKFYKVMKPSGNASEIQRYSFDLERALSASIKPLSLLAPIHI